MGKFAAIYIFCEQPQKAPEEMENISSLLVQEGYFFTVRYHQESPWIQLFLEEPENVVQYTQDISQLFREQKLLGLAAYTVSDSVSFCLFQEGKMIRILQSGFSSERKWEFIQGEEQQWEAEIFKNITLKIGNPGMVSSHIQQIGILLNLPGFGIPRMGEPWTKEIIN
ncbi:MAG: hypothetical protein QNJ64_19310 [Crocosphaera sp.]|nr:hypothetical protein [Crocosphaera sp.]